MNFWEVTGFSAQVSALIAAVTAHVFAFAGPAASPPPKRFHWRGTARPPNRHCLWLTNPTKRWKHPGSFFKRGSGKFPRTI